MLTHHIPPDKTTFPTDFSRFIVVEFQLDTVKMSRLPGSFVCNKKGTDNSLVTMPGAGIDGPNKSTRRRYYGCSQSSTKNLG